MSLLSWTHPLMLVKPWCWALCRRRGDSVLTFTILGCRESPAWLSQSTGTWALQRLLSLMSDLPKRQSPFLLEAQILGSAEALCVYSTFWADMDLCLVSVWFPQVSGQCSAICPPAQLLAAWRGHTKAGGRELCWLCTRGTPRGYLPLSHRSPFARDTEH